MYTFKQLVKMISEINTIEELYKIGHEIDVSFENGKISWNDHEMLFEILRMIIRIEEK